MWAGFGVEWRRGSLSPPSLCDAIAVVLVVVLGIVPPISQRTTTLSLRLGSVVLVISKLEVSVKVWLYSRMITLDYVLDD